PWAPARSASASSPPRMVRQNRSCAVDSVEFLRNRENSPCCDCWLELIAPTEVSTICHNRFVGFPTRNNNTVTNPATTILVSIDSEEPASKIPCSSNTWTPASTDSINRLKATPPMTRATRRSKSWCTIATSPSNGAVSVNNLISTWASNTAALANNWNSAYTSPCPSASRPAPVRLPSSPVKYPVAGPNCCAICL